MKIILRCLMVISMLLSVSALAEEAANDTLKFRGIEWYSKFSQVYEAVSPIDQLDLSEVDILKRTTITNWALNEEGKSNISIPFGGTAILKLTKTPVGGYTAFNFKMEFIPPIKDGVIDQDPNNAQFYKAQYYIRNDDILNTYKDLRAKLTKLYGTPGTAKDLQLFEEEQVDGIKGDSLWQAKDGSLIWLALFSNVSSGEYDKIMLTYAAHDCTQRLAELNEIIEYQKNYPQQEEVQPRDDNYEGL